LLPIFSPQKEKTMAETTTKAPAKKPAAKPAPKAAVTKPVEKKAPAAKKAPAVNKPVAAKPAAKNTTVAMTVSAEQRYRMIAEAAYYRAESNHFKSDSVRDWIEAESDIAALLSGSK
jgi:outer membrane biosynthesis protein TonB